MYLLLKPLPMCPVGRLFKSREDGSIFHSMTDDEALAGKLRAYEFTSDERSEMLDEGWIVDVEASDTLSEIPPSDDYLMELFEKYRPILFIEVPANMRRADAERIGSKFAAQGYEVVIELVDTHTTMVFSIETIITLGHNEYMRHFERIAKGLHEKPSSDGARPKSPDKID